MSILLFSCLLCFIFQGKIIPKKMKNKKRKKKSTKEEKHVDIESLRAKLHARIHELRGLFDSGFCLTFE